MQAARALGWLTDTGEWKTLKWDPVQEKLQEVPDAPTKTTERLITEANELRKTINAENLYRFQSVYGLRKDHQTSWVKLAIEVSLRNQGEQVWDGLSSSQGEGRPVVSGPDASMVDEGRVHCEHPCERPYSTSAPCHAPLCHTMPLPIVDVPVGLQAVMQCLLWPFWCDAQRCHLLHGLYRQLWHNSISKPLHMLHLDNMLQWAAVTRRWRKLHTPPTPAVMLQDLLRSHKSDAHSGEWGTPPHALKEVGARALISTTCMCLPIPVTPQHVSLQACVDDWGSQSSRPCLLKSSETVFLALNHTRKGDEAGSATFSDLEAIIQLPVAASNTSDIFLLSYQARSLVIRDDNAQICTIHALHRRVKENDCTASALSNFALPSPRAASVLLVALRRCECQGSDPC